MMCFEKVPIVPVDVQRAQRDRISVVGIAKFGYVASSQHLDHIVRYRV